MERAIAVLWGDIAAEGKIEVRNGKLVEGAVASGGVFDNPAFRISSSGFARLRLEVEGVFNAGANSTIVSVLSDAVSFSFFVRDVNASCPIYIPEYQVIVTDSEDDRSYGKIEEAIRSKGLLTHLRRTEMEEEAGYREAELGAKDLHFQTWLGISRDIRIFAVDYAEYSETNYDWVQPKLHAHELKLEESNGMPVRYNFRYGRGTGYGNTTTRRLEQGALPILHGQLADDEVIYRSVIFVSLEHSKLTKENVRGTHYLVAGGHSGGNMFTSDQLNQFEKLMETELTQDEETVLFYRVEAVNTSSVPRYCYVMAPVPNATPAPTNIQSGVNCHYDGELGFGTFSDTGHVYSVNTFNGQAMPDEEMAVLLQPGETAAFVFAIPHRPLPIERAKRLAAKDFHRLHEDCRIFWLDKLSGATAFSVPETRVGEMLRAGLLHLDLITYGREPDETAAPTIGIYSPIGSESAPIIMYMDSVGWHDLARRSIMYFIDKQHDDGLMQNFQEYMLETGCVLWLVGEHYRYTQDEQWILQIQPQMRKAFEFLVQWRRKNEREDLAGKGYGMLDGKAADPEDPYHSFMLNGYAYMGLKRIAGIYASCAPDFSAEVAREAETFKRDIRTALFQSLAKGPAVPLGDGSWCPTVAPWTESIGPVGLFAESGRWYTHGTMFSRDSLLGPLYLVYNEVIGSGELVSDFMMNYHTELMCMGNVGFSQPYYSRHPWIHLSRREVKPFLQNYYNSFAALADRETYTFGEHLYGQTSPHKTHEEAWFLMETRWMLYMEENECLRLLPGIPRKWMEHEKKIVVDRAASYFGPISFKVQSDLEIGTISAKVEFLSTVRLPECLEIRLPHPMRRVPGKVRGGVYEAANETVKVRPVTGSLQVVLYF